MKQTPLYAQHVALNAKMVPFGGWTMPLQYQGIKDETRAVREAVGMFDVSHMGEIRVKGDGAARFLDYALSRKISGKNPAVANYAILCAADGGVVDDLLVYELAEDDYWLVVNAANKDRDLLHLSEVLAGYTAQHAQDGQDRLLIEDESDAFGQIAVQGPRSLAPLLAALDKTFPEVELEEAVSTLKRFRQQSFALPGSELPLVISRTGYTGEDGYEVYMPAERTVSLWRHLLDEQVTPCGLGARDALRLEAGLPLYGHEMSAEINPLDAGMARFVELDRDFVGAAMAQNHRRRLIALVAAERAIPREQYPVFLDGRQIGEVTSGSFSPTLAKGIAFALVPLDLPEEAENFAIEIRGKLHPFVRIDPPFVKK